MNVLGPLLNAATIGLVIFLLLKIQKENAQNQIKNIKLKDDEIEKEISNMPLNELIDDENKRTDKP